MHNAYHLTLAFIIYIQQPLFSYETCFNKTVERPGQQLYNKATKEDLHETEFSAVTNFELVLESGNLQF